MSLLEATLVAHRPSGVDLSVNPALGVPHARRAVASSILSVFLLTATLLSAPAGIRGQETVPEWLLSLRLPNQGAKSVMTPTGWGAAYGAVFAGVGVSERNPWLPSSDGVVGAGLGLGDPILNVGVQLGVTISDLSEFDNYAYSFKLHRYLGGGTAVAVGGGSLLTGGSFVDDLGESFYLVVSHVFQGVASPRPGVGRLHLSAGVGSGRFANTSERDVAEGKHENGTWVFGNAALEVARDVNLIVEWSGINLHAGVSKAFQVGHVALAFSLAAADLTGYSGDGARLLGGAAVAVGF